ncbi:MULTISPECIES: hypothetical protein [Cellulophaga]|nr:MULTISPECIES: hypothetical protein [Cellulophaga]MCR1026869.1 hypothetical protein [Cellulophaga baltica]
MLLEKSHFITILVPSLFLRTANLGANIMVTSAETIDFTTVLSYR